MARARRQWDLDQVAVVLLTITIALLLIAGGAQLAVIDRLNETNSDLTEQLEWQAELVTSLVDGQGQSREFEAVMRDVVVALGIEDPGERHGAFVAVVDDHAEFFRR